MSKQETRLEAVATWIGIRQAGLVRSDQIQDIFWRKSQ